MNIPSKLPDGQKKPFVDNEFGVLRRVALCRPDHFDWAAENAIVAQARLRGKKMDRAAAIAQHDELRAVLEGAGVDCVMLAPDPHLPMQTFTRDSGVMTPWGLLICQMARPERRGEWAGVTDIALAADLPVWKRVTAGSLEGGDVQILRPGEVIIGISEVRTTLAAATQVADWFREQGWMARLIAVPAHFLHLDVLFSVLNDQLALCATDILEPDDVAWLAERFRLLPVGYRDVMAMGCNATALGNDTVLSAMQHGRINAMLRAEGLTVLDPDLEQFVLEGGSTHCLTMPLERD